MLDLILIMEEESKVKVRYCASENCTFRMSSIEKDRHVLCPSHTGWQCTWDTRCNVCKEWTDSEMKEYLRLQQGKARKKVYKDRKRALKLATGETSNDRPPHSLSPSSSSSMGETVPSPFIAADRNVDLKFVNKDDVNIVNFGAGTSRIDIACTPSTNPPW